MLTKNEYGFSVENDNPFLIFPYLQEIASQSSSETIDLSRGDPGYSFTPSQSGRQFFSYLVLLDSYLNSGKERFLNNKKTENILEKIKDITRNNYQEKNAAENLKNLQYFIKYACEVSQKQGLNYGTYEVLNAIFKRCTVSGGCYNDPQGEEMIRAIVANWHQQTLETKIDYKDVIFTNGASQAIGTLFKILGRGGGFQYLRYNDQILITSPGYSPYINCLIRRDLRVLSLSIDPVTGEVSKSSMDLIENHSRDVRVLILIDPNNPTGFSLDEEKLKIFADFAKRKNCLVITDEVYSAFFETKKTMMDLCPERTIRISSRSKIERSTGLRFGEIIIAKEGQKYISENILKDYLPKDRDIMKAITIGKGPGGTCGELQHTTFVPGPMQILGASHIILGKKERKEYREYVYKNRDIFYQTLNLPHTNNMYYVIFDLNKIDGAKKTHIPIEQKLIDLAKLGVVYLPAYRFFSDQDLIEKDYRNTVRACIVNATQEKIKEAAEITKKYLCS